MQSNMIFPDRLLGQAPRVAAIARALGQDQRPKFRAFVDQRLDALLREAVAPTCAAFMNTMRRAELPGDSASRRERM